MRPTSGDNHHGGRAAAANEADGSRHPLLRVGRESNDRLAGAHDAVRAPALPPLLWGVLGMLAYFASAKLGMALFSLQPSNITLLWLPAGIGLALCLHLGWRALPMVFVASFAANLQGMASDEGYRYLLHVAIAAAADALAAWLAAWARRHYFPAGLSRSTQLFGFIALVCLLPTASSALILSLNLVAGGYIAAVRAVDFAGMLVFADTLGILLMFPLIELWRLRQPWRRSELLLALGCILLALAMAAAAFAWFAGLIYLLIPVLLYHAFYGREQDVVLNLALTVATVTALASTDLAPFSAGSIEQSQLMLQCYLLTLTFVTLGVLLQQRDLRCETAERERWQSEARHDALTGLPNRVLFDEQFERELARSQRSRRPFCVATLDLDHYKRINDDYGHAAGDEVLVGASRAFLRALRAVDMVARVGGEEFALLLPETRCDEAQAVLQRLLDEVAAARFLRDDPLCIITVSAGVVEYDPGHPRDRQALLAAADQALYRAKHLGRNRVEADCGPLRQAV